MYRMPFITYLSNVVVSPGNARIEASRALLRHQGLQCLLCVPLLGLADLLRDY